MKLWERLKNTKQGIKLLTKHAEREVKKMRDATKNICGYTVNENDKESRKLAVYLLSRLDGIKNSSVLRIYELVESVDGNYDERTYIRKMAINYFDSLFDNIDTLVQSDLRRARDVVNIISQKGFLKMVAERLPSGSLEKLGRIYFTCIEAVDRVEDENLEKEVAFADKNTYIKAVSNAFLTHYVYFEKMSDNYNGHYSKAKEKIEEIVRGFYKNVRWWDATILDYDDKGITDITVAQILKLKGARGEILDTVCDKNNRQAFLVTCEKEVMDKLIIYFSSYDVSSAKKMLSFYKDMGIGFRVNDVLKQLKEYGKQKGDTKLVKLCERFEDNKAVRLKESKENATISKNWDWNINL